ncbi:MAG: class I SAM-dependent methyltransferase [Calditrichaeota bacterium]|nr:MAG: class I SAM-dependent methyltransferase [Calditrichota bacterium]
MKHEEHSIQRWISQSRDRVDLWVRFINSKGIQKMVEVGVYRGDFAERILKDCPSIRKYYMLDPWRHLSDWNKPANQKDDVFESFLKETLKKTDFAQDKRIILRGKTTEVIDDIANDELDFAYIDGDHTLRGISIDLLSIYPKIKPGGWIGGDDFHNTIWQHSSSFEPTMVFPYAVYFAEAMNVPIYALPYGQFLIEKDPEKSFSFKDTTGKYQNFTLQKEFLPRKYWQVKLTSGRKRGTKILSKIRQLLF